MSATATPQSGTKDRNYNLITVTQLCLEQVWRLECNQLLRQRLGEESWPCAS